MQKLYVKIEDGAFMWIHLVEQVQLSNESSSFWTLLSPTQESWEGTRSFQWDENVDPARKLGDAMDKRKCQKFTFGSDGEVCCAGCRYARLSSVLFPPLSLTGGRRGMKHACTDFIQFTGNTEMWSSREHNSTAMCILILVFNIKAGVGETA